METNQAKIFAAAALLTLSLAACNAEQVSVDKKDSGSGSSAAAAKLRDNAAELDPNGAQTTVVFQAVSLFAGSAPRPVGAGYLPSESASSRPFVVRGPHGSAYRFVGASSRGLLFADALEASQLTLVATHSGKRTALMPGPSTTPLSLSADAELDLLAWNDSLGGVWLLQSGVQAPTHVTVPNGMRATRVTLARDRELLVEALAAGGKPKTLLYGFDNLKAPALTLDGAGAAISPDGTRVATIVSGNAQGKLLVIDRSGGPAGAFVQDANIVRDLSWKSDGEVTYVAVYADGSQSLRLLDLSNGDDSEISPLHLAGLMARDGMVCPTWLGNDVFFSDYRDGKLGIYRAQADGVGWRATNFANPRDNSQGFACPKLYSGRML